MTWSTLKSTRERVMPSVDWRGLLARLILLVAVTEMTAMCALGVVIVGSWLM